MVYEHLKLGRQIPTFNMHAGAVVGSCDLRDSVPTKPLEQPCPAHMVQVFVPITFTVVPLH